MQIIIIIGISMGIVLLIFGILYGGGSILWFLDFSSAIITFGGCICSMMVGFSFTNLMKIPTLFRIALFPQGVDIKELIVIFVSFAEKARREGLLALEDDLNELEDPFMKKGLMLVVDGTDPELVRNIMETEIDEMASRHDDNKRLFDEIASYAPAFGMIGTLMGLVMMLVNLQDRSTVGPYLAIAIITTFYGAVLSYLVAAPMATRLDMMTGQEIVVKSIVVKGVLAIQSGDNPRIVKDKLVSFLQPSDREKISEEIKE